MDFHAAMETFAEAWVAANTQTAVNSADPQNLKQTSLEDLPTLLPKEQLVDTRNVHARSSSPSKSGVDRQPGNPSHAQPHQPSAVATSSATGDKPLPIHCIVEQMTGAPTFDTSSPGHTTVDMDSYAILPGSIPMNELVRAALVKLGYSPAEAMGAKGVIQLKNWKPLPFESITDNLQSTIDHILGDLTSVAVLRIRLSSSEEDSCIEWNDQTVRSAVIDLLKDHSQSALAKISPLSQSVISNIANWKYVNKLSLEKCKEFGEWFCHYREKNKKFTNPTKDCRLTFHHEQELPLLRKWFRLYKNPSVEKLLEFANRLNEGQVRQERPKVTVGKLRIWWKNEKQRSRKQIKEKSDHSKDPHLAATSSALCGSDITLSAHSSNDPSGPNFVELRSPSKNIEPHFICSPTSDLCQELSVDTSPQTDTLKSQETSSNIDSLL